MPRLPHLRGRARCYVMTARDSHFSRRRIWREFERPRRRVCLAPYPHESDGQLLSWSKVVGRARSANSLFKPIGAALGRFTKACALRPQTRFAAFRFSATNLERLLHTPRATRRLVVNPAAFSRHRNFKVNDGNCAELTANSFSGGCWRISTPKIRNVRNRFPSQRFLATPEVRIHPAPPASPPLTTFSRDAREERDRLARRGRSNRTHPCWFVVKLGKRIPVSELPDASFW
jgi:ribosomal protein L39E